jgi:hypothetical protein
VVQSGSVQRLGEQFTPVVAEVGGEGFEGEACLHRAGLAGAAGDVGPDCRRSQQAGGIDRLFAARYGDGSHRRRHGVGSAPEAHECFGAQQRK